MPTKALLIVNTAVHCFILRFILYSVQRFSGLSIASKMILSVIIWGFADFGNELQNINYLPTNFEMELSILSENHEKNVYLQLQKVELSIYVSRKIH